MAEDGELVQASRTSPSQGQCSRKTYHSSAHSKNLLEGLVALRQGAVLFDVVLLVEGTPLQAHRILLAASCDYFRGMFAGGLREMREKEIQVHGVSCTAMSKLLDFIYTSELELDVDNVQEVLSAACLLQMQDVIGFCCDFLFSWLDKDNILEVYKLADLFGLSQLSAKVDAYILKNIQTFSRTAAYRQLPQEKVFSILSSNDLEVNSENEVYEAALHYHYTPEQVEMDQVCLQDPLKMMEAVRFCLMERQILQRLHDRLKRCPLRDTLAAALQYHKQEVWQPVMQSSLTQLRSHFRCIVGFGGMRSSHSETLSNEVKFLNPVAGEWRDLTTTKSARMSNQGIAVLNNFVYLIGGDNNTGGFRAETRCWRYDPCHDSWVSIQPLQQQHADHCVCVVGAYLYAIGGRDYRDELKAVERYDPHSNTWEYVAPLRHEVYAHAGAVLDGKMYIGCGRRGPAYLKETWCYDPGANQWESRADGPLGRAWHGMAAANGRVYVIGGSNDDRGYRRDVLKVACYNPETDNWSTVSPLPSGHGEPGVVVLDSRIYVVGGRSHNKNSRMDYVHVYDPKTDRWEAGPPFEDRISGLATCVLLLPRSVVTETDSCPSEHRGMKNIWEDVLSLEDFEVSDNSSED